MNIRRLKILVIIYLASLIVAGMITLVRRHQISQLINNAGAHGQPVFIVCKQGQNMDYPARLYDIEGKSAGLGLIPNQAGADYVILQWIDNDGALVWQPIFETTKYKRNFFPSFLQNNKYLEKLNWPERFDYLTSSGQSKRTLFVRGNSYIIYDNEKSIVDYTFTSKTEGALNTLIDYRRHPNYKSVLSEEGDVLFIYETDPDGSTGIPFPLTRYDIYQDRYSTLGEFIDCRDIIVGPHSNVLALSIESQPWLTLVIDGNTGRIIHTEQDVLPYQIGDRWFLGLANLSIHRAMLNVAFDMQNSWSAYHLSSPESSGSNILMYEPPPNGLDGMNSNYVDSP